MPSMSIFRNAITAAVIPRPKSAAIVSSGKHFKEQKDIFEQLLVKKDLEENPIQYVMPWGEEKYHRWLDKNVERVVITLKRNRVENTQQNIQVQKAYAQAKEIIDTYDPKRYRKGTGQGAPLVMEGGRYTENPLEWVLGSTFEPVQARDMVKLIRSAVKKGYRSTGLKRTEGNNNIFHTQFKSLRDKNNTGRILGLIENSSEEEVAKLFSEVNADGNTPLVELASSRVVGFWFQKCPANLVDSLRCVFDRTKNIPDIQLWRGKKPIPKELEVAKFLEEIDVPYDNSFLKQYRGLGKNDKAEWEDHPIPNKEPSSRALSPNKSKSSRVDVPTNINPQHLYPIQCDTPMSAEQYTPWLDKNVASVCITLERNRVENTQQNTQVQKAYQKARKIINSYTPALYEQGRGQGAPLSMGDGRYTGNPLEWVLGSTFEPVQARDMVELIRSAIKKGYRSTGLKRTEGNNNIFHTQFKSLKDRNNSGSIRGLIDYSYEEEVAKLFSEVNEDGNTPLVELASSGLGKWLDKPDLIVDNLRAVTKLTKNIPDIQLWGGNKPIPTELEVAKFLEEIDVPYDNSFLKQGGGLGKKPA